MNLIYHFPSHSSSFFFGSLFIITHVYHMRIKRHLNVFTSYPLLYALRYCHCQLYKQMMPHSTCMLCPPTPPTKLLLLLPFFSFIIILIFLFLLCICVGGWVDKFSHYFFPTQPTPQPHILTPLYLISTQQSHLLFFSYSYSCCYY